MRIRNRGRCTILPLFMAVTIAVSLSAGVASAREGYSPVTDEHPLKIARYFLYPVGKVVEITVTRPLQALGSITAPPEYCYQGGLLPCPREPVRRPDHRRR